MKAPLDALKNVIKSGKTQDWTKSAKDLESEIARAKIEAVRKPKEERDKIMQTIQREEQILKMMKEDRASIPRGDLATNRTADFRTYTGAGDVGVAANQVIGITRRGTNISNLNRGVDGEVRDRRLAMTPGGKMGDVFVHVTGYCIKCKQQIEGGDQVASLNPAGVNT
jgi:hypothetical protein